MKTNKEFVKFCFNSLVQRFTKGKKHHKVNFEFKNCLDMGEKRENFIVGGRCRVVNFKYRKSFLGIFKWWSSPRVEYIVSFLNNYPSPDMLRASIVHEFTHLYFFSELKLFSCEHEDDFYSRLDFFEDWIDKEMGFPMRKNKSEDWNQHTDPLKRRERWLIYTGRLGVNLEVKEYKIGDALNDISTFGEPTTYMPEWLTDEKSK